tara:strand:+ start:1699 stop:3711 length:2013 start_codon:yes stop_codon:yes gene_type:complete
MALTQISSRGVEDTLRWSLGASGTDHYTFTGPGLTGTVNDPTIYLSRGQTYIFENNNSSTAHPFQIQSVAGSGGTAYNTGVTNNGGGGGTEIKITVAHDAPDNLYYQCTAHPNMGGTIYITGAVADGSITEAKLADDAVTSDKIAANPVLTGTGGIKVPVGSTGERVNTQGMVRFNSSTGLLEYFDGTTYKGLDIGPTVSSVNSNNFESSALPTNIVITGSNFSSSVLVKFVGADGSEIASGSVTRDSATQVTAQIPNTITSANEPYKIQVTNTSSGFSGILDNAFNIDAAPVFGVASGSLGTLATNGAGSSLTAVTATDDEGDSITFSVTAGSLPSGITLNSNGTFAGTANAVTSNTTSTFSVTASDGTNTSVRQYTITVNVTYVQLSGSGTWSVPSGINTAEILIVGGGASGSRSPNVSGGGGGAGGVVHTSSYTFTATDKSSGIAYSVGEGGTGPGTGGYQGQSNNFDGGYRNGADTTFAISGGTITAKGGGGGAGYGGQSPYISGFSANYYNASQGGSGGGGAYTQYAGASSNQGTFSGWTSYGNAGGDGDSNYTGGGGGGAGAAGSDAPNSNDAGAGGAGQLFSSFTSYGENGYFGGGGGGGSQNDNSAQGGVGGGGNGGYGTNKSGGDATDGTGGGGGGVRNIGYQTFTYKAGDGGNGTILIKY